MPPKQRGCRLPPRGVGDTCCVPSAPIDAAHPFHTTFVRRDWGKAAFLWHSEAMPSTPYGLRKRLLAWAMAKGGPRYERLVEDRKRQLFPHAQGRVLEIGAGVGPNLRFLTGVTEYVAAEPNRFMLPYLQAELKRCGLQGAVIPQSAEALLANTPEAAFDTVVCTLGLCSVSDASGMLRTIRRVLRPGGKLLLLEHVGAETGTGLCACQVAISPLFWCLADGCKPNRRTAQAVEACGFARVQLDEFRLPLGPIAPHICGWAER